MIRSKRVPTLKSGWLLRWERGVGRTAASVPKTGSNAAPRHWRGFESGLAGATPGRVNIILKQFEKLNIPVDSRD